MEKPTVNVDVDPQSPFVLQLQKHFPQFEIVANMVTPNDHANARAFSHCASKLIEAEVPVTTPIIDIGSAPARRMYSEHRYHCVCPMKCPEDPDRLTTYANRLVENATKIANKRLDAKLQDLKQVLETPDIETDSICFHDDATCRWVAEVSVMQDVYIDAPSSIYHQALKGIRKIYWIGFDTTPFMFKALAGSYPSYNTNWADEKVLEARNIGLCSTTLSEGSTGKLSIMRKKRLLPGAQVYFSVGSTLYPENRSNLMSWHLPSVFHLKGRNAFTCRCDTVVNCDGYVVKKITISPNLIGTPAGYAVTNNSEGFLLCKVTDTVRGERVSFPVCMSIPATICDQMTGILATDINPEDAQKLLVGLNQRIVVNGKTNRNVNTMQNHLLPAVAQGFSKWAKERKADGDDEKHLGTRERSLTFGCLWAFRTKKVHSFYRPPGTQTIVKVESVFTASPLAIPIRQTSLPISLRLKLKMAIAKKQNNPIATITQTQITNAIEFQKEATETARAVELNNALPPLRATEQDPTPSVEHVVCEVEELSDDIGGALVETPRGHVRILPQPTDVKVGNYLVISPQAVLRNDKLSRLHPLAEQIKVITHTGRKGRYEVAPYSGKMLLPCGTSVPWPQFCALAESATLVFNEREMIDRKLAYIAQHGPALNTDEEQYKVIKASAADSEYVFDIDRMRCVPTKEANGLVLVGELTQPPYHELAMQGLYTRPAAPYPIETIGVIGTPGSGKSAIIKNTVTTKDLVTSGKKENCKEIETDVLRLRNLVIKSRTVDSVLLNGCTQEVDVLHVDEAFACHAGTLLALIAIVKPRCKVVLYGDPKQCGFFNLMQIKVHFNNPEVDVCSQLHYKYISRRCILPVTAIVSSIHYDGKMRTTNTADQRIEIDTTGTSKPKPTDLILTCFRGWVKQLQLEYPRNEVMTAAASQGLTRKRVYAVRYKVNENPLYAFTSEHVNVLLTRTEHTLVWKTLQGDPWIKHLSNVPKGNFSATVDEWHAEHERIMNAIRMPTPEVNAFSCKTNVCWAKALVPVLATAGLKLSGAQWTELFPQFERDEPHSATFALDVLCIKYFGMDLTSGIFAKPTVPLTFHPVSRYHPQAHWDNANGEQRYGFDPDIAKALARRFPVFSQAAKGHAISPILGTTHTLSSRDNYVPVNRIVPHTLKGEYTYVKQDSLASVLSAVQAFSVLVVSSEPIASATKQITWVAPLGTAGCIHTHRLPWGFPKMSLHDAVAVNMETEYRGHHYQQCEDHVAILKTLGKSALANLRPGGTLILRTYGYADRNSENVITALARKFARVTAVRSSNPSSNTEIYLIFRKFDNNRSRQFTLHHLNRAISALYESPCDPDGVGAAPSYSVIRGDITATNSHAIVVPVTPERKDGVYRACSKKWGPLPRLEWTEGATLFSPGSPATLQVCVPSLQNTDTTSTQQAYRAIAKVVVDEQIPSLSLPVLTMKKTGTADTVSESLNHLVTALDQTDANVTIYCLDKSRLIKIKEVIARKEAVTELIDDDLEIDEELTWVHPDSCLRNRTGFSTDKGKLYSYLEGTKFHQMAKDFAEIRSLFPDEMEANEHICSLILGETIDGIRERCPVTDNPPSSPPKTVPCLCMYAMTPERALRLKSNSVTQITVCSSFVLKKHHIKGVQKIQCTAPMLFNPTPLTSRTVRTPPQVSARAALDLPPVAPMPSVPAPVSLTPTRRAPPPPLTKRPVVVRPSTPPPPPPVRQTPTPVLAPRTGSTAAPTPTPRLSLSTDQPSVDISFGDFSPAETMSLMLSSPGSDTASITFGDFDEDEVESIVGREY
ncbi:non-structural protein [Eilat virus]|nr:non-structural polyprotein nsP123 [Eilat virus]AFR68768.1 non-structural protein [Eilat virus]